MSCRFDEFVLHFVSNLRNLGMLFLVDQPTQKFVFFHEITLIYVRNSLLEQNYSRNCVNSPLLGLTIVIDFHKRNIILIAIIINVFQFYQYLLRFLLVFVI